MENTPQNTTKNNLDIKKVTSIAVVVVVFIGAFIYYIDLQTAEKNIQQTSHPKDSLAEDEAQASDDYGNVPKEEIVSVTKEILGILHKLYYISIDNSPTDYETDSALILGWTTESMKDKNDLVKLINRTEPLVKNKNKVVATTAMALSTGMMQLVNSNDALVTYFRKVDPSNTDIAEFQYQVALFSSTNKDAFNTIIEGTSLFPFIWFDMQGDDDKTNDILISEAEKKEILDEIDRLFEDVFIEDEKNHDLTGNTNAVVFIVKNYRDFLTGEEK